MEETSHSAAQRLAPAVRGIRQETPREETLLLEEGSLGEFASRGRRRDSREAIPFAKCRQTHMPSSKFFSCVVRFTAVSLQAEPTAQAQATSCQRSPFASFPCVCARCSSCSVRGTASCCSAGGLGSTESLSTCTLSRCFPAGRGHALADICALMPSLRTEVM